MKISTRNLLAELLVEALDDPTAALTVQCLTLAFRANLQTREPISTDQLLKPSPASSREAVLAKLQASPLLTWGANAPAGHVDLCKEVSPESEWQEIRDKLTRFSTALQEWSPAPKDTPLQQALKKGVLLFNHQLFFEVHEVLEAQWRLENGKEKIFLQGLIQIAVAFHHLQNRNVRGAVLLFQDGIAKLAPHQPAFLGVELSPFLTEIKRLLNHLQDLAPEDLAHVRAITIPRLQRSSLPQGQWQEV